MSQRTRSVGPSYVQIYPSDLVGASRMIKIARSVHGACDFDETHLVGIKRDGVPDRERVSEGVDIVRVAGSTLKGNLGRVLKVLLWQPRVFLAYRRAPLRAVAVHNVWILPLGWALARATSARFVYNPHELETETYTMRGLKKWAARLIERSFIRRCDVVSVVNEPIARWYADEYSIPSPVQVSNNPTFTDEVVDLRSSLGVAEGELLYIHTGYLTDGRNIPAIVEAFKSSKHHVAFLGDGKYGEMVRATAKTHANIHWVAPVEPERVVPHVRAADVGLSLIEVGLDKSDLYSVPNKLLEALAANRPALCTELPEARRLLSSLADQWIISDIAELPAALERITEGDVQDFKDRWPGLPTWDENVTELVKAYRSALSDHSFL